MVGALPPLPDDPAASKPKGRAAPVAKRGTTNSAAPCRGSPSPAIEANPEAVDRISKGEPGKIGGRCRHGNPATFTSKTRCVIVAQWLFRTDEPGGYDR